MKRRISHLILLALATCGGSAWAQKITCLLTVTNVNLIVNLAQPNSDASGDINVNCTRPGNSSPQETYTIAIGPGSANQNLSRTVTPTTLLPYQIFKDPGYSIPWSVASPSAPFTTTFTDKNNSFTTTLRYYFRVPTPAIATEGNYSDPVVAVTLNTSPLGIPESIASLSPRANIAANCRISTSIAPITFNYTSFSASPVLSSTPFNVNCTNTTSYTMALSKTSGVQLGLVYTLALSGPGATGNGLAQPYNVNGSMGAGQAGSCPTGTCTATDPVQPTITITY